MQVALRGRQVAVAQELRERGQIDAGLQQMGGEGVAQRVDAARLGDTSPIAGTVVRTLRTADVERPGGVGGAREQPVAGFADAPIDAQRFEQARTEQRVAILPPLPATTRMHMRSGALSMSATRSAHTSDTRSPAA